jgi:hypothetical protein
LAALCVLLSNGAAFAQAIDENLWVTNGTISTVVRDGGTIYVGGNFTYVGPATGGGVPLGAASGAPPPSFPKVVGVVLAVISDGAGGWYLGGTFTAVGGLPRSNLAHVASDLSVSAWDPTASNSVRALAVSGSTVYAGGDFTSSGGQARNQIVALDATTGAATAWDAGGSPTDVVTTLVANGSTVYAGGYFASLGGQARRIAALNTTTGAATAWNPNSGGSPSDVVTTLVASGSAVYAGGGFTNIGGQARNHIAALDATTGAATAWNPNANDFVYALAVSGSTIYAGGDFTSIGGQARNRIAALDAATGAAAVPWNPNASGRVNALALSGTTVYAGGVFNSIGGKAQSYIAAMGDLTTPTLLSLVSARAETDRVELTWFASDVPSATVYRSTVRDNWEAIGQISADGTGRLVYLDAQVIAGTRYGYRLGVIEAGQEVFLGEAWVDVPVTPNLALAGFRSNPTREALTVAFSLPDASPARLQLFDVGGRRIWGREVGMLGAGSHLVTLGDGRTLAPGVYLLRLSQGSRSLTARAVVLQ